MSGRRATVATRLPGLLLPRGRESAGGWPVSAGRRAETGVRRTEAAGTAVTTGATLLRAATEADELRRSGNQSEHADRDRDDAENHVQRRRTGRVDVGLTRERGEDQDRSDEHQEATDRGHDGRDLPQSRAEFACQRDADPRRERGQRADQHQTDVEVQGSGAGETELVELGTLVTGQAVEPVRVLANVDEIHDREDQRDETEQRGDTARYPAEQLLVAATTGRSAERGLRRGTEPALLLPGVRRTEAALPLLRIETTWLPEPTRLLARLRRAEPLWLTGLLAWLLPEAALLRVHRGRVVGRARRRRVRDRLRLLVRRDKLGGLGSPAGVTLPRVHHLCGLRAVAELVALRLRLVLLLGLPRLHDLGRLG